MLRRLAIVPIALSLALSSCQPDRKPVTPDGGGGSGGAITGAGDGMTPLAPITRAVELLPPDTLLVMDVAGPVRLAEIIGRDALVKQFPKEYGEIVREMSREVGTDLLDPKELQRIGVDTGGRMGLALIDVKPLTVGFYWTVADSGRFRQFAVDALKRQGQEIVSVPMSGAELLRVDGQRAAIVLRGPVAMFVFQEGGEPKGDPGLRIATADPHVSLANDKHYRKATGALAPADWTTYIDVGALWSLANENEQEKKAEHADNWARQEIARLKKEGGATPERLAELERQANEMDEFEKTWAKRREAERALVEKLVGGAGRSVWTVSAKPGGLVGEGQLELGADAMVMKTVRNHPGSPALPKALSGRPVVLMTAASDPAELISMFDLFLQTEGASWAEATAEVKKEMGIDIDAELRPLVTGTAGFAVTMDGKLSGSEKDREKIGMAIDIELADAAKASALLDRAGKRVIEELKKRKSKELSIKKDKGGAWVLTFPKWRAVHVSIAGHHLVASTDPGLAKRLAEGKAGDAGEHSVKSALAAASLSGAAFGGLFDAELFGWLMFGFSSPRFGMSASVEAPGDEKVPKSKQYKAKLREVEKARAHAEALSQREQEKQSQAFLATTAPWGAFAGNVTEQPSGLLARGGLFVRSKGGIAGAIMESLTAVKALSDRPASPELDAAFSEMSRKEQELSEIRRRDIDAWRKKHPDKGVVPPPPVMESAAPPPAG